MMQTTKVSLQFVQYEQHNPQASERGPQSGDKATGATNVIPERGELHRRFIHATTWCEPTTSAAIESCESRITVTQKPMSKA